MPLYSYKCECGEVIDTYRTVEKRHQAPMHCGKDMRQVITAPSMVFGDIEPYQAVAADKETGKCPVITGRKQHREFLRRNGYEEVGNG